MIATMQDLLVLTRADFERLPDEGRWEVVEGRAVLVPPPEIPHQIVSAKLNRLLDEKIEKLDYGFVVPAVSVFIPREPSPLGEIQTRTPDLIVSRHRPRRYFEAGEPPDLVIEILSTPRGNVERTEKLDDYALAGIGEYWIVDPFKRAVEIYRLADGVYRDPEIISDGTISARAFPGLEIEIARIWPK
ncbi:MAG TPA: Uma2 family endonuclease [Bryobacteraceae bacterium]|nr:Uma2 family endonuclease [Bryobacteraceae bacterium]